MPGILPMKVIKVGSSAQSRIAQACDRCRSKKIRCDGIRPSCTQCSNVGFECKTSDKLSRRAFPRGYTESLEERVRALELEARELKDLLDEKDEKIDMLARIHSNSPRSPNLNLVARSAASQSPATSLDARDDSADKGVVFKIQQSAFLLDDENCDSYMVGLSSGRTLVDAFIRKAQQSSHSYSDIHPDVFFRSVRGPTARYSEQQQDSFSFETPPRLVSDQLINVFFQEWAPLFPVLHRPTFLSLYEDFTTNPKGVDDKTSMVQLNLVFSIAALSSNSRDDLAIESFDAQWHAAIDSLLMDNSMVALQCFVLAQISCLLSADYPRLLKYKGLAIGSAQRLGLFQSQKGFALGALTAETRKKTFWSLYVLDCFSAIQLGVPRMIKDEDVHCEYPVDADDEYITDKGFLPTLPGESTKLSSALALFRVSRIFAKLLTQVYATSIHADISLRTLTSLAEELDTWCEHLPSHLRLHFAQDKPSTNTISSRSPILSMVYHYIRALVFRPAVCANLGDRASSATLALSKSSKHVVQLVQLLEERSLSFTLPLNRNELLLTCGFGILFQSLDADQDGKLHRDCQKMVGSVSDLLEASLAPTASDFRHVSSRVLASARSEKRQQPALSRHNSEGGGGMRAPQPSAVKATQKHFKALTQYFSPAMGKHGEPEAAMMKDPRRATVPNISALFDMQGNQSNVSLSSIHSEPAVAQSEPRQSRGLQRPSLTPRTKRSQPADEASLDYLAFNHSSMAATYQLQAVAGPRKPEVSPSDWERLLGHIDNGQTTIYDTIYGGQPVDAVIDMAPLSITSEPHTAWSPEMWNVPLGFGSTPNHQAAPPPQSVLSLSDESLTSGEEFPPDFPSVGNERNTTEATYPAMIMPEFSPIGGMDHHYGM